MINPDVIGIPRHIKGSAKPIMKWPEANVLRQECAIVETFDEGLHQLIADMYATIEASIEGVALAANQIGVSLSIIAIHSPISDNAFNDFVLINPKFDEIDPKYLYSCDEGCLSIPGFSQVRKRPQKIRMTYRTPSNIEITKDFQGLEAFIIQHEMEHLIGKLFIDGFSRLKLDKVKKKILKFKRFEKQQKPSGD